MRSSSGSSYEVWLTAKGMVDSLCYLLLFANTQAEPVREDQKALLQALDPLTATGIAPKLQPSQFQPALLGALWLSAVALFPSLKDAPPPAFCLVPSPHHTDVGLS